MKQWDVTYKTVVYNTIIVEADTLEEAEAKAEEMIGEVELNDGTVAEQEVESIIPQKEG